MQVQGDTVAVAELLGAKWKLEGEEKELRDRSNRWAVKMIGKFPRWREQMQKL